MGIAPRQIGWSNESNLLWQLSKQLERLNGVTSTSLNTIIADLSTKVTNQQGVPSFRADTFANIPAAGQTGRMFVSTDTLSIYRDNGTTWDLISGGSGGGITGTGTTNYLPKWTGATAVGDSQIFDNGSGIGINTATPIANNNLTISQGATNKGIVITGPGTHYGTDTTGGSRISAYANIVNNRQLFFGRTDDGLGTNVQVTGRSSAAIFGQNSTTGAIIDTELGGFIGSNLNLVVKGTTGNVLIGTTGTDAGFKLDVNGTARVQGRITSTQQTVNVSLNNDGIVFNLPTSSTSYYQNGFTIASPDSGKRTWFAYDSSNNLVIRQYGGVVLWDFDGVNDYIRFSRSVYMATAGGSVGIGTTTPTASYTLDVVGASRIRQQLTNDGGIRVTGLTTILGTGPAAEIAYTGGQSVFGGYNRSTNISSDTVLRGNPLRMWIGGTTEVAQASTAGNFLVGTTTDTGRKLEVVGTAAATRIQARVLGGNNEALEVYSNTNQQIWWVTAQGNFAFLNIFSGQPFQVRIGGGIVLAVTANDVSFAGGARLNVPGAASAPSGGLDQGWIYYDTTLKKFRGRLGDPLGLYGNFIMSEGANVINDNGADYDFRIEGDTNANLFFLDASVDNIGIGTNTPNASALLDISSTTKGFLPPRMTGAQAEAIASPAEGLMVYSTDGSGTTITSKGWWGFEGATWVKLN